MHHPKPATVSQRWSSSKDYLLGKKSVAEITDECVTFTPASGERAGAVVWDQLILYRNTGVTKHGAEVHCGEKVQGVA